MPSETPNDPAAAAREREKVRERKFAFWTMILSVVFFFVAIAAIVILGHIRIY
jgi:hypothetical protein